MKAAEVIVPKFVRDQLSVWRTAAANFRQLKDVKIRKMEVNGLNVTLQFNPERIRSSAARTDDASLKARICFLCADGRSKEQISLKVEGRTGRLYDLLINPYPIFPEHLVLASVNHTRQTILHRFVDMLRIAKGFTGYTLFYNGPHCGASAPDHLHFQVCPSCIMPLETEVEGLLGHLSSLGKDGGVPNGEEVTSVPEEISADMEYVTSVQEAQLYHYKHFTRGIFALRARTHKSMAKLFYRLLDSAPLYEGDYEPRVNVFCWFSHGEYRSIVVFRRSHRSHHYFSTGEDHLTMSPGCADMAGLFIVPQPEDFAKLNPALLEEMLDEVSVSAQEEKDIIWRLTRTQRHIEVGIMSAPEIVFEIMSDGAGPQKVSCREGMIDYNGVLYKELYFEAATMSTMFAEATFILYDVTIGKDFHWEQKRDFRYAGSLKFIAEGNKVTAINIVGIEDYLLSVISSEMKSTAPLEFLKAHAVISRSWVMSQLGRDKKVQLPEDMKGITNLPSLLTYLSDKNIAASDASEIRIFKWFDHEDHKNFDVCADDHCQRYQGLTMAIGDKVRKAIDETWGQVLVYDGELCDTRFSKCCGGMSERFSVCWEDKDYPYLQPVEDPYCNTSDEAVLATVLNDYDLQTKDFHDWEQTYTREELRELIRKNSGIDLGEIKSIEPLERGASGRIRLLRVIGSEKTIVLGKELIIRKMLSESHLRSSAFEVVDMQDRILLKGKGWGHGVGLCQIGAAVMASKGFDYGQILKFYYTGAELSQR